MEASNFDTKPRRLLFFDNMRSFVIVFVVLQHAALVYRDYSRPMNAAQAVFKFTIMFTDVFMMPILFFTAGYFALASIRKRGPAAFVASKFRRIWIPWLLGVLVILPPSVWFLSFYTASMRGDTLLPFAAFWRAFMWDALTPYTGFITSANIFSHKHLWFLSVLFAMFLVFAAVYRVASMISPLQGNDGHRQSSKRGVILALFTVGVVTFVLFFLVSLAVGWGYHSFLLVNLVHMDFARLSTNAVFFGLGVFAFSRSWFEGSDPPGLVRG
ncbi:MAG: acyltransferase family protein, partial [Candidatus Latescibacteria bacterium]|nr:acyltransferase family protein [Candidatus Latescibacterota bacterium]